METFLKYFSEYMKNYNNIDYYLYGKYIEDIIQRKNPSYLDILIITNNIKFKQNIVNHVDKILNYFLIDNSYYISRKYIKKYNSTSYTIIFTNDIEQFNINIMTTIQYSTHIIEHYNLVLNKNYELTLLDNKKTGLDKAKHITQLTNNIIYRKLILNFIKLKSNKEIKNCMEILENYKKENWFFDFIYIKTKECPICQDDLHTEYSCIKLNCGHAYHFDCLYNYIYKTNDVVYRCAYCRENITSLELSNI